MKKLIVIPILALLLSACSDSDKSSVSSFEIPSTTFESENTAAKENSQKDLARAEKADDYRSEFIAVVNSYNFEAQAYQVASYYGYSPTQAGQFVDCVQGVLTREAYEANDEAVLKAAKDPAFFNNYVSQKSYQAGNECAHLL
nr:hypothetical protein 13 [Desulfobulbaceae bacterium]